MGFTLSSSSHERQWPRTIGAAIAMVQRTSLRDAAQPFADRWRHASCIRIAPIGKASGGNRLEASPCRAYLRRPELVDQRAVAVGVARLQVVEQLAPARHHAQQPAARVVILDVGLEVVGETVDALR